MAVVVLGVIATRDGDERGNSPPQPMRTESPLDAKPHDLALDLRLPPRSIDIHRLMWKTKAEVEKELGAAKLREDGRWQFDRGSDALFTDELLVMYDSKERAVSFEVPNARSAWSGFSTKEQ